MADTDLRDDETLTAFLDEELPPAEQRAVALRVAGDRELGARLGRLERVGEGIDAAFDAALDAAPTAALDAMLQQALAEVPPPRPRAPSLVRRVASGWSPRALAASLLVALALAGGLGFGLGAAFKDGAPRAAEGWHQAVAEYWSLTTAATLKLEPSAELGTRQLALAGAALGLPLTPDGVALEGASFRGAQLYDFGGKPLVQIAYLDPDYGPIAYCVIRNGQTEGEALDATEIDGFGVVRWSGDGFGRMVIGHAPPERLRAIADMLAARSGQGA
jgi:anti-sigma factor RsiW